ncbi:MAG TPA: hypothetical protein ENK54_07620 [Thiotrichales bacterium]|nr:hypothetical protein [Thiotrichales bacterium]
MEMNALRWVLLGLGIGLLLILYLSGRDGMGRRIRRRGRREEGAGPDPGEEISLRVSDRAREPLPGELSELGGAIRPGAEMAVDEEEAGREGKAPPEGGEEPSGAPERESPAPADEEGAEQEAERLVLFFLVAREVGGFGGARLAETLAELGMEHGEMSIFHRYGSGGELLYSLADSREPGAIAPDLEEFSSPALILFTHLRRGRDNPAALEALLSAVLLLQRRFRAEVRDESKRLLDQAGLERLVREALESVA